MVMIYHGIESINMPQQQNTINLYPIPSTYGKSTYIWLPFMVNIAKQIQIYKTITIFTWFLNHPGIAKKTGRVFRATVRWGASSWQHHQRHRNLSPPTLLPLVWQEVGEDGIAKGKQFLPVRLEFYETITQRIHGTGIFRCMNGWFLCQIYHTYCWWFRNPAFTSWGTGSLSHDLQGF